MLAARESVFIVLLGASTLAPSHAAEPAWWTAQKAQCGLPPTLAYNTWIAQGSKCPRASSGSAFIAPASGNFGFDLAMLLIQSMPANAPASAQRQEAVQTKPQPPRQPVPPVNQGNNVDSTTLTTLQTMAAAPETRAAIFDGSAVPSPVSSLGLAYRFDSSAASNSVSAITPNPVIPTADVQLGAQLEQLRLLQERLSEALGSQYGQGLQALRQYEDLSFRDTLRGGQGFDGVISDTVKVAAKAWMVSIPLPRDTTRQVAALNAVTGEAMRTIKDRAIDEARGQLRAAMEKAFFDATQLLIADVQRLRGFRWDNEATLRQKQELIRQTDAELALIHADARAAFNSNSLFKEIGASDTHAVLRYEPGKPMRDFARLNEEKPWRR